MLKAKVWTWPKATWEIIIIGLWDDCNASIKTWTLHSLLDFYLVASYQI